MTYAILNKEGRFMRSPRVWVDEYWDATELYGAKEVRRMLDALPLASLVVAHFGTSAETYWSAHDFPENGSCR